MRFQNILFKPDLNRFKLHLKSRLKKILYFIKAFDFTINYMIWQNSKFPHLIPSTNIYTWARSYVQYEVTNVFQEFCHVTVFVINNVQ